jgi:hypothetical protein
MKPSKKPPKPAPGDVVQITFWDHAEASDDVLRFEVFGRIYKITPRAYCLKSWCYVSDIDRVGDSNEDNENRFAILKRAIDEIKVLK